MCESRWPTWQVPEIKKKEKTQEKKRGPRKELEKHKNTEEDAANP